MRTPTTGKWLTLLSSFLLAGCAGPRTARETAGTLALYTAQLKAQTDRFAASRTELTKMRTASLGLLEESALEAETRNNSIVQIWSLAGRSDDVELVNNLQNAAAFAEKQQDALETLKEQHLQAVQAAKTAVDFQGKKLDDVAKGLGTLAQKPALKDELSFLAGFISEVQNDLQKASTNSVQQSEAGKALVTDKTKAAGK
jgi:hypothetical protein